MFNHFYHQIFRKTVIAFGTLFNNIEINRDGGEIIKVPLAYGPTQKFLARLEQQPDLNKPVQISLPRISFEFTGVSYDSSRKLASTQHFATSLSTDSKEIRKMYHPVPYTLKFSAKTHLFGPVPETKGDIITRVSIGVAGGDPSPDARRDLVYQKPIATKAYSGTIISNISDDILAGTGVITVDDASNISARTYITLDEETLYIKEITNNDLTVNRGVYRTSATEHVGGTPVYLITEADNDLIESGDNFGFSG